MRAGRLHRLRGDVFAVGHELLGPDGRWWAALLALGDGAFVSHHSAGDAYRHAQERLRARARHRARAQRAGNAAPGSALHRPLELPDDEVTTLRGLPITTPGAHVARPRRAAGSATSTRSSTAPNTQRLIDFAELHALA